jgi:hypothetical protein
MSARDLTDTEAEEGQRRAPPKPAGGASGTPEGASAAPEALGERARTGPRAFTARDVLALQRTVGNRAVGQFLARSRSGLQAPAGEPAVDTAGSPAIVVQRQEVGNQFYGHGGFMGAARDLLNDPLWSRILQTLMPDVYADVQGVADDGELMPMLENNPVMAAYGMRATQALDQRQEGGRSDRIENVEAMEWDVWLDPDVIRAYAAAPDEATELSLDKLLVDTIIIAHGNTKQTFVENVIGYPQYDAVRETPKSALGGATSAGWMDLFGRALRLGTADNPDEMMEEMKGEARHTDEDDQSLYQTFRDKMPFDAVVEVYKRVFRKDHFSVLLDIKSRGTPPDVMRRMVLELNRRGVHVYGIGTFSFTDLNNVDEIDQVVDGEAMGAPKGIKFFHGIGNLETACLDGEVFEGDPVMFNAGSILDTVDWDADEPDADDARIEAIIQTLAAFKSTYGFHLGLYVQEGATDHRAASKITAFSNQHADVFDLGFAWGGISNDMGPVSGGGTGMGSQAIIPWNEADEDAEPGTPPSTGFVSTFSIKRGLESRHFEVKRGRVDVRARGTWDSEPAPVDSYTITLRQSDWFVDSRYDRFRFPVDETGTARWEGLENGTYYLEIDVAEQDRCTLNGDIEVSF